MANGSNVNVNKGSEDNDDVDDIPEEMDDSATKPSYTSAVSNGNVAFATGMSLEELDEKGVDEARDEVNRAAMDPPAGDWKKSDRWDFDSEKNKRVYVNDKMPDDIDPAGRTFFTFFGEVEGRTVGEHTYTPKLQLRLSPDVRYKMDDPDTLDLWYKLWLRAKDAFLAIKGHKPKIKELITFLSEDEYILRTTKGDNGPFVVDIKKEVERRQRVRR